MLIKQRILVVVIAAFMTTPALAKIYKWKDSNGVTQYTATPPPQSATKKNKEVKEVKIRKKPRSSLTYKPKITPLKNEVTKAKQSKKSSNRISKRSKTAKNDKFAKDREECKNASASEKNKIIKQWEKYGKSAMADGREDKAGFKRGMKQVRDVVNNCNF